MKRLLGGWLFCAALLTISACGMFSTPRKDVFYRLPEVATSAAVIATTGPLVYVPPFAASGLHGERAVVYAHDDGTALEQYTYDYWVDSPRLLLQQALVDRLRASGARRVVMEPSVDAGYTVRGRIRKFEKRDAAKGATAEVSLEFELLAADAEVPEFARAYQRTVTVSGDAMATSAAALGQAAQDIVAEFVTDLDGHWGP